jgi:hypothetical protein
LHIRINYDLFNLLSFFDEILITFLNSQKRINFMNKKNLLNEECAQISVELIIVLAAVVAVVLVLVSQLQATSQQGSKKLDDTAKNVFSKIDEI